MARRKPPKGLKIAVDTTEHLDPQETLRVLERRATRERPLGLLVSEARRRGYTPGTKTEDIFGVKRTLRLAEDIQPPKGSAEAPVRDLSLEIVAQSFTKSRSKDLGAVMTITVTGGNNRQTEDMLLEAPGGDLSRLYEYNVKGDAVVRANSPTDRLITCMEVRGDVLCVSSLLTCIPLCVTIPAYLYCLIYTCMAHFTLCAYCAACHCAWWCKGWPIGCCR